MRLRISFFGLLSISIPCLFASGCATVSNDIGAVFNIRMISTRSYDARPSNYEIALTENDFKEPYIEIAEVRTHAYEDRLVDQLGRNELRRVARDLGGDAVIRIARNAVVREEMAYRPGNFYRIGTQWVDKYTLSGVVVRFTRNEKK
jgi:hypothetical protein